MNVEKIESSFTTTKDKKCSTAKSGMVSTAFPDATKAGVEMLKKGGNAVDAACASALAIGVCEPQSFWDRWTIYGNYSCGWKNFGCRWF